MFLTTINMFITLLAAPIRLASVKPTAPVRLAPVRLAPVRLAPVNKIENL